MAYLDQWCYDHLARDRAGDPTTPEGSKGCYKVLRDLALTGSVIFPLSQAHYRENWKRKNLDARWDTAVVMGELSGFHTLQTSNVETWDALEGVVKYTQSDERVSAPDVIGWGFRHCLIGKEGAAKLMNSRTGERAQLDGVLSDGRSMADLERSVAYRLELAVLALRDPRLLSLKPIPDAHGDRFAKQEVDIRQAIDNHGRSPKVVRNTIEFLAYRDSWIHLVSALQKIGFPIDLLDGAIMQSATSDGRTPAMREIVAAMPVQGIFTELRSQAHLKEQWKTKASDLLDFWAMATVLPFVDYLMADAKTHNLAKDGKIHQRGYGRLHRNLTDLCNQLEEDLRRNSAPTG